MDTQAAIRSRIPVFPGYDGEQERALSDEYVRAYLGEALVTLRDNLGIEPSPRFDRLLFRAEFANQDAYKPFANAYLEPQHVAVISDCDLRLIELADRARRLDFAVLDAFLDEIEIAFDKRDRAMESGP